MDTFVSSYIPQGKKVEYVCTCVIINVNLVFMIADVVKSFKKEVWMCCILTAINIMRIDSFRLHHLAFIEVMIGNYFLQVMYHKCFLFMII